MPAARTSLEIALEIGVAMIVAGAVLLILGLVLDLYWLWVIGIILLVFGAVFWVLGRAGRPVGGRRVWY
jgi:hypothetical protein